MEAKLNITYQGQNGDLQDTVNSDLDDATILRIAAEAVQGKNIPGIVLAEHHVVNFRDFVVDRFEAQDDQDLPYRIAIRPKTPFGR